jgi:hypothetical protein
MSMATPRRTSSGSTSAGVAFERDRPGPAAAAALLDACERGVNGTDVLVHVFGGEAPLDA